MGSRGGVVVGSGGPPVPVGPVVVTVPDGEIFCGRDALSHRTQYVAAIFVTPPPRLGV